MINKKLNTEFGVSCCNDSGDLDIQTDGQIVKRTDR